MDMAVTTANLEGDARAFFDSYFAAIDASDLKALEPHYAADVVAYDAIGPFEFRGRESYLAHWKACQEMCQHMSFEPQQPQVTESGDLAVNFCLVRAGGTAEGGEEQSGWVRVTTVARRQAGRWQIVHEHFSVPFDPQTMKVITDHEA